MGNIFNGEIAEVSPAVWGNAIAFLLFETPLSQEGEYC